MVDSNIGLKIKKLRTALGISQMKLAESVGVSFQQIQKYENGINKVSLEKLYKISRALNVDIRTFIIKRREKKGEPIVSDGKATYNETGFDELSSEEIQIVLRFRAIKSDDIRDGVINILKGAYKAEI